MFKGFRDFILRGNVLDLAVAVIIGGAFGKIVASLVGDVLTPLIAAVIGKPDFSAIVLHVGAGNIKIGNFCNEVISFLMVAAGARDSAGDEGLPGVFERYSIGGEAVRALCAVGGVEN